MELRDFIVTPVIIILVYVLAWYVRPHVTDAVTRKYFLPALTVKILGALALGLVYQFYYDSGDTFNYHTNGSRPIWEAFLDSPEKGVKLLVNTGDDVVGVYKYSSQITFYRHPPSFFVVRIAAIFDLITFSTYSATAVLFSVLGLTGMWMFFLTFYRQAPKYHAWFAVASFFIPSIIFWGSGILKDTIVLACLGLSTFHIYKIFFERKYSFVSFLMLAVALFSIFSIRKFVLQAYLPGVLVWIFASRFTSIRSTALRIVIAPLIVVLLIGSIYYMVTKVGEDDGKYDVKNIAQTAKITAYDIRYWSGRNAGSGYSLGTLDGSFGSMIRLAPQAINVSLFRPYLWEVKNPLMLLSALESLFLLAFCLYIIAVKKSMVFSAFRNANVVFCMTFSIIFAFAVGVSTFNFGTLVRYKIPLLPFFIVGLVFILYFEKNDKKLEESDNTET